MDKIITIFCYPQNKGFLKLIKKHFEGKISKDKTSNYFLLKINISRENQNKFAECFADSIILHYKYNALNDSIELKELKEELRLALIKALTQFDCDLDKQLIISRLNKLTNKIYVESFLKFYVPEFEQRLNELIALANNNKAHFVMSETFNELFKFILTNLNFTGSEVIICKKYKEIIIYNVKGKEVYSTNEDNELNLILKLIEILPKKIIIKVPKTECKALNFVCKLFNDYIEFKN